MMVIFPLVQMLGVFQDQNQNFLIFKSLKTNRFKGPLRLCYGENLLADFFNKFLILVMLISRSYGKVRKFFFI